MPPALAVCIIIINMENMDNETIMKTSAEQDRLAFTVLAIEASAQKMGVSP